MEGNVSTLIREIEEIPQQPTGQTTCRHHWSIEAANGLVSGAVCKYCHEERAFRNSMRGIDTTRRYRGVSQYGMRRLVSKGLNTAPIGQ